MLREPMTVKKLKELLNPMHDDTLIMIDGYEEGYDCPDMFRYMKVVKPINPASYEGEYSEFKRGTGCVLISSSRRN